MSAQLSEQDVAERSKKAIVLKAEIKRLEAELPSLSGKELEKAEYALAVNYDLLNSYRIRPGYK